MHDRGMQIERSMLFITLEKVAVEGGPPAAMNREVFFDRSSFEGSHRNKRLERRSRRILSLDRSIHQRIVRIAGELFSNPAP